jgi:hypothetical protein
MTSPNLIANGTIACSTFVKVDSSTSFKCIQAAANTDWPIGISQEWADAAPIPGASTNAAVAGEQVKIYGLGDICLLQSTTAGWTAGDKLTSNSTGQGVTASGSNVFGAIALETISGSALGRVQVIIGLL